MYTTTVLFLCGFVGNSIGYNIQRDLPYYTGPNDPYPIRSNFDQEQSQRLFWGNGQGSNQVGGTGFWATLTNKFPFLGNMFGRMELPSEYGVPNYINSQTQYDVPNQAQLYQAGFRQQTPFSREVAITDDAVIITPPQVPIASQPVPAPIPQPAPVPQPQPQPSPGYHYDKPQYRFELPQKYY
ncbi:uncharacterized protein [Battus philenor]|uniref:uncharacterized protein n=1 Tax=Battus philenor TaxID=42288 RepID=UPI0035CF41BC